jgi:inosose dehydratase
MGGIVSALKQMGYDGWITVELDAYEGPPKEAAEISRAYLQSAFGRQINQRAA